MLDRVPNGVLYRVLRGVSYEECTGVLCGCVCLGTCIDWRALVILDSEVITA